MCVVLVKFTCQQKCSSPQVLFDQMGGWASGGGHWHSTQRAANDFGLGAGTTKPAKHLQPSLAFHSPSLCFHCPCALVQIMLLIKQKKCFLKQWLSKIASQEEPNQKGINPLLHFTFPSRSSLPLCCRHTSLYLLFPTPTPHPTLAKKCNQVLPLGCPMDLFYVP